MTESSIIPTNLHMDPITSDHHLVSPSSQVSTPFSPSQHSTFSQAPSSLYLSADDQQRVIAAQIRQAKTRLKEAIVKGDTELCKKECLGLLAIDVPLQTKYDTLRVKELLYENSKNAESVDGILSALVAGLTILEKYAKNLLKPLTLRPSVWRTVKFSNEIFKQRVASIKGSLEILKTLGYTIDLPDGLTFPQGIEPDQSVVLQLTAEIMMLQNELTAYKAGKHPHANVLEAQLLQHEPCDGVDQRNVQLQSVQDEPTEAPGPKEETQPKMIEVDKEDTKSSSEEEFCSLPPDLNDKDTLIRNEMCHVCGEVSAVLKCDICDHETSSFCRNCDSVWHKNPRRQDHKRTPIHGDILETPCQQQSETIRVIPGKSSASTSHGATLMSTDEQLKLMRQQHQQNWQKSREQVELSHNASDKADDVLRKPVHHPPGVSSQQSPGFSTTTSSNQSGDREAGPQSLLNFNSQTRRPHYTLISGPKSFTRKMTPERSPTPPGQMSIGPCPKCYAMINYSENKCSQCSAQITEDFKLKVKKDNLASGMQYVAPKNSGPQGDAVMVDPKTANLTLPNQSPPLQYPLTNIDYNNQHQPPNVPVSSNSQLFQPVRPSPPPYSTLPNLYPPQTNIPNTPGSDMFSRHPQSFVDPQQSVFQPIVYPPQTVNANHPESNVTPQPLISNMDPRLQQPSMIPNKEILQEVSQGSKRSSSTSGGREGYHCQWQCEHCTFLNVPGTRVCTVCDKTSDSPVLYETNQNNLRRTQSTPPLLLDGSRLQHSQSVPFNMSGNITPQQSPPNLSASNQSLNPSATMPHQSPLNSSTLLHQSQPNLSATFPHHFPQSLSTLPHQSSPNLSTTMPHQSSPNLSATMPHHSPNRPATTLSHEIGRKFIQDQDQVYQEKLEAHRQYKLKLEAEAEKKKAANATPLKSNVAAPQQSKESRTPNILPKIQQSSPLSVPHSLQSNILPQESDTQQVLPLQPQLVPNKQGTQQPLISNIQPQQPSQSFIKNQIIDGEHVEQATEAIHIQSSKDHSPVMRGNTIGQSRLVDIVEASPQQFLPKPGQSGQADSIKKALELIEAKKHQEDMIISGQKLIRLIRAADVANFSLEELEIAVEISEDEEPITWLKKFWDNMIDAVIAMATNQDGGDFGKLSYIEARKALGECRGRLQDAVDYCRASREKKLAEILRMTATSQEDALDSLLQNGGDMEKTTLSLNKQSLAPFIDHIWADIDDDGDDGDFHGDIPTIVNSQEIMNSLKNVEIDIERRLREVLVEGRLKTWEEAESVMQILEIGDEDLDVTLEDIVEAVKTNSGDVYGTLDYLKQECEICYGYFPMHYIRSMSLCSCQFCTGCMKQYMEQHIRESPAKNFVCPVCGIPDIENNPGADNHFQILHLMLAQLVEEDVLDLFQRKLRDWNIQKEPNFRWCASCECGFIFNPQNPGQLRMECPDCKKHTCFECKKIWEPQHQGITCEEFAKWKADNDPEHQAAGLAKHLQENGIDCPRCNFRYALARGGCMHFTCTQCKHEFCSGCSKPFIRGDNCKVLATCAKAGMHCHHPRDCLYYLRDYDVKTLQQLLQEKNVKYNTEPAAGAENTGKCGTMEQKEIADGLKDELCGREVPPKYAGLCELHYKEYLVTLINNNSIDPIEKMSEEDLLILLQRNEKQALQRKPNEALPKYRERLIIHIKEVIPLPKRAQRNL